ANARSLAARSVSAGRLVTGVADCPVVVSNASSAVSAPAQRSFPSLDGQQICWRSAMTATASGHVPPVVGVDPAYDEALPVLRTYRERKLAQVRRIEAQLTQVTGRGRIRAEWCSGEGNRNQRRS